MTKPHREKLLPDVATQYIERVVTQMKCRRGLREEVRRELTAHIEDALAHYSGDATRDAEARAIVAGLGNDAVLAELMRRGKLRNERGALTGLVAMLSFGVLILLIMVLGSPLEWFFNLSALPFVVGLPVLVALATYGIGALLNAYRALTALVWNVDTDFINFATPRILRNLAKYTYVCTLSGGLVAAIQALQYRDISQLSSREFGAGLLPLFYAVLVAEGLYRPAAIRADFLLHLDSDSPASKNYEE